MLKACVAVCAGLLESVTLTVKFDVPFGPVGVPVIAPALLIVNPGGKLPALVVNVKGANPPVAATVWLYAVPSTPAGSEVVVMLGGAGRLIVMLNACVADCGATVLASVTFTVKLAVPLGPVGVPLIAPEGLRVRPAGSDPALTENVSVPAPPVSVTVWLYAVPSVPAGSDVIVIEGIAVTVMFRVAVLALFLIEVAVTTAVPVAPFAL